MEQALQAEFRRRGISRLCHFTPIVNLPSIFDQGSILSVEQARANNVPLRRIDHSRWDGELSHVSLSIQFPNAFLMRRYGHVTTPERPEEPRVPSAVLDIDPVAVDWDDALFSPVNAATAGGQHLGTGIVHFRSLFALTVPNQKRLRRSPDHTPTCPTDMQAELMVASQVPVSAIRCVYVDRLQDLDDVQAMDLAIAVHRWPALFDPEALSESIRRGEPPRPPQLADR